MVKYIKENRSFFSDSLLNSYSQIFFSIYKPFSLFILAVTFIDFYTGLMGLLAVVTTSTAAFALNLNKSIIAKGLYGFNGLLVGLGLGLYYSLSWHLVFIVFLAAVFTLFISVAMQGVIGKYQLPYLSIPFLVGMWTFTLATKHFEALGISERGIYTMNELYVVGGHKLVQMYEFFNKAPIPEIVKTYCISLSAILFQYNVLAGFLIAIGLLLFSRIAFTLSIIGFSIAYGFYHVIDADITLLEYSYIGFNYILTSIAIGGFFLIPSVRSYFSVSILVPLVAILSISMSSIFYKYNLAIYSLPFNMVVLLFLYVLKFRMTYSEKLTEVYYQNNSPEKNLYTFINNQQRFQYLNYVSIKLPFMGKWTVAQGHDGEYTHQSDWRFAWDFVINDDKLKQFKNDGLVVEDYYCFNKPVMAPAEGTIEEILDNIDDNPIGDINLIHNWGNTIIIKHTEGVYSKLSHLRKGSIAVKKGDKVKQGQILAKCGNSGRSPYPHLHFQMQATPYIGSATIFTPFSNYLLHNNDAPEIKNLLAPKKDDVVSNTEVTELLSRAFHFIPGQQLHFSIKGDATQTDVRWDVKINSINQTYLECSNSKTKAYFVTQDDLFYFSHFEGKKESLLHHFYLGSFKVQTAFYKDYILEDQIPLFQIFPYKYLWFHDFISPFVQLVKSVYKLKYSFANSPINPSEIKLESCTKNIFLKRDINKTTYELKIDTNGINEFIIKKKKNTTLTRKIDVS